MQRDGRAFTLLEMLSVIGIIVLLVAILLPALSRAREHAQTLTCLAHLRELSKGWQIYSDENDGMILPEQMYDKKSDDGTEGIANPANMYDIGNGLKYRPRWAATMGAQVGIYAFNRPYDPFADPCNDPCCGQGIGCDRQDYDSEVYQCPAEPTWIDERNYGYGYNHQFLGNARQTNGRFHNFPVIMSQIKKPSGTVIAGDCMGTAAGVPSAQRGSYTNDGPDYCGNLGNHGSTLDPPRLTEESDRGTGEGGSPRTAVDPRHRGKANVIFGDSHGATMTPYNLGYRITKSGRYADADPNEEDPDTEPGPEPRGSPGDPGSGLSASEYGVSGLNPNRGLQQPEDPGDDFPNNRWFSGTGRDDDPPPPPLN